MKVEELTTDERNDICRLLYDFAFNIDKELWTPERQDALSIAITAVQTFPKKETER